MEREDKLLLLQYIQDGKIKPHLFEDLPGGILRATTKDLGDYCCKTSTNHQCYFAPEYEDENGVKFKGEALHELTERYGNEPPFVLHVVEKAKKQDRDVFFIDGILLLKQSKQYQIERVYFSFKKNAATMAQAR